jgi:RecB family exonuclease
VYLSALRLRTTPFFEKIFSAPDGWRELSDYLIEVLAVVGQNARGENPPHDNAPAAADGVADPTALGQHSALFALIIEHIRRLATSIENCDIELKTKTYAALLRRSLQSVTIPFEGEPLEGVQVMGILETRALDFENIIFLSSGDANLPGSLVGAPSFIPYNLKAAYGLPTPEHHEGVWAYHFFRLISRARNVDLVWSRTTDDGTPGSVSRYVLQLDYESPHDVEYQSINIDVNLSPPEPVVVEKDVEKIPLRLSPSLFYSYAECPLKFYFRAVARLKPEDEVTEGVDDPLLGNLLHRAMQLLYTPLIGVHDPRATIRELIGSSEVERAANSAVAELCAQDDTMRGDGSRGDSSLGDSSRGDENWGGAIALAHRTITDYINRAILPFDASQPKPFTIEKLEERIETTMNFGAGDSAPSEKTVTFYGIADRVDRLADGTPRVVDYKTGNPANNASALLQMGLYAMMLGGDGVSCGMSGGVSRGVSGGVPGEPQTHLYYVREMLRGGYVPPEVDSGENFRQGLNTMLTELFDSSLPFAQTPDPKPCAWCDFAPICRRTP